MKDVEVSLARGRGPDKRAPEVRVEQEAYMPRDSDDEVDRNPKYVASPRRAWLTARGGLLRALEVTGLSLHAKAVQVFPASEGRPLKVRLGLPVSKNDVAGVGKVRTLVCVCGTKVGPAGIDGEAVCAACAAREELERRAAQARVEHPHLDPERTEAGWQKIPLFATVGGAPLREATIIGAWQALCAKAAAAGAPPPPPGGDQGWQKPPGPSARRSGAKLLARLGWALWMIQWFGRWASAALKGCVEEVWAEVADSWA